jgi:hypothetical protein
MEFISEADIPLLNGRFTWTKAQLRARRRVAERLNKDFSLARDPRLFRESTASNVICEASVAGCHVMFLSDASFILNPRSYVPGGGRALTMDEVRWVLSSENTWVGFKMVRKRLKRKTTPRVAFAHSSVHGIHL